MRFWLEEFKGLYEDFDKIVDDSGQVVSITLNRVNVDTLTSFPDDASFVEKEEDITLKTNMELMDVFVTTLIKCFMAQEKVMTSENALEVAKYSVLAQKMNAQRNKLIRALDKRLNSPGVSPSEKTYK